MFDVPIQKAKQVISVGGCYTQIYCDIKYPTSHVFVKTVCNAASHVFVLLIIDDESIGGGLQNERENRQPQACEQFGPSLVAY